jgi:uncharacterized protein (DUF362 family)/Pyruvate/2-oxoacid:ferredoxin oxidoreductase delta subunit
LTRPKKIRERHIRSKLSKVALIRCESYDYGTVLQAVRRGIGLLGGMGAFVKKNQKVLLKPNLLVGDAPEKCVTTHPSVFKAVAELAISAGAAVSFGDSPGFGSTAAAAKRAGLLSVAEAIGVALADFKAGTEIFYDEAAQNKRFTIARAVIESDVIISLPKLKAHAFEKFTGCVKNQFGCIPGILKGEYHIKLPDANDFARMLVDLNNFIKPALYVMDGIQAMEGNGPRGGTPRHMGLLLFSTDPIALDATVCRLINLDPEFVPTIKFGHQSGAGAYKDDEIELVGDSFAEFKTKDFVIERTPLKPFRPNGFLRFINNRLVPKPHIVREKCVSCGACVIMCPTSPKSVDWIQGDKKKPPAHNYKTCIRCYCCQEICPESAIELKVPVLRKIFRF